MNTEQDLRTFLTSKGESIVTIAPPVETARRRAAQLRSQRLAAVTGTLVIAAGVIAGTSLFGSQRDFATTPVRSDGPKLAWEQAEIDARANEQIISITPFDGGYFALGTTGPAATVGWVSPDGRSWERTEADFLTDSIIAVEGGLLAAGAPSTNPADPLSPTIATVWTSTDGRTWSTAELPMPALSLSDPAVGWTAHVLDATESGDRTVVLGRGFLSLQLHERLAPAMGVPVEAFLRDEFIWTILDGGQVVVSSYPEKQQVFESTLADLGVPADVRQAIDGGWTEGMYLLWVSQNGGASWELVERPFGDSATAGADQIVGTQAGFFAVGLLGDTGLPGVWFSEDGRTWENRDVSGPEFGWLRSPTGWNGQILVVDHDGEAAWTSTDGRKWERLGLDTLLQGRPAGYRLAYWTEPLPVGDFGVLLQMVPPVEETTEETLLLFSKDGTSWSIQPLSEAFGRPVFTRALAVGQTVAVAAIEPYDPTAPESEFISAPNQIWVGRLP